MTEYQDHAQTIFVTIATLSMGFYFGSQYTGRQAQATYMGEMPAWMHHVKTVNMAVLGVFCLCVVGAVAIERHKVNNEGV